MRLITVTSQLCLAGLLLNGCVSSLSSEWEAQKAESLKRASRLYVPMPQPVRGTIKRIAVLHPNEPQQLGGLLDNEVRMSFDQLAFDLRGLIPQLEVVERSNLDAAIREIQFQTSGIVRDEELVKLGRMLAADHLLLYEVTVSTDKELEHVQYNGGVVKAVVSCRILDIETGALVYRETIVQTISHPTPPTGKMYRKAPSANREWALSSALYGVRVSLQAAFSPKLANGIFFETPGVYPGPGAKVAMVLMDGPADIAGIRDGDIIMKINGIPINSSEDLERYLGKEFTATVRYGTEEKDYVIHVARP